MPRIKYDENFKETQFNYIMSLLFPNNKPSWITKDFFKEDRTHIKCISVPYKKSIIISLEEGEKIKKQDLILNSIYLNLDKGTIIPKDIEYINFKKTMKEYSKAKKICRREERLAEGLSASAMNVLWFKYDKIIKKIEKMVDKKILIVDNIELNNLAAEEFLTLKIGQRRNKEDALTFLVSETPLDELNNQFKSKKYKKIFNILYGFNFKRVNIEEMIANERKENGKFKGNYEGRKKEKREKQKIIKV
jgi:hypothetical protein